MFILKTALAVLVIFGAFWADLKVSVLLKDGAVTLSLWKVLAFFLGLFALYQCLGFVLRKILSLFSFIPDPRKGVDYLQQAFSGLLMKDDKIVSKNLEKAKRHLGDIPFISWLEGQKHLINGDTYKARSIFFSLSEKEKNTTLGAYSLAQLAIQDNSNRDSIEAIKSILKVYPNSQKFLLNLISLNIKNKNFDEALDHVEKIFHPNRKEISAVIYYEKWKNFSNPEDLKKSYKLAPQIPNISIDYSELLFKNDEKKLSLKVLKNSFEKFPFVDTFKKYVNFADNEEKIKRAKKLLNVAPQSWIPNFYLAKFYADEGMVQVASEYIKQAYKIKQYSFIADEVVKINSLLDVGDEVIDLSAARNMRSFWKCSECGNHSETWCPICSNCSSIATYKYEETAEEILPAV